MRLLTILLLFMPCVVFSDNQQAQYRFIENKGQWEPFIQYKTEFVGGALFLEKDRFTYDYYDAEAMKQIHTHDAGKPRDVIIRHHAFRVKFLNSNPQVIVHGRNPEKYYYSYFIGKDHSKWASRVKLYRMADYYDLWDNIDLNMYTNKGFMKYDLAVKPGGAVRDIELEYEGADGLYLENGNLHLITSLGKHVEQKPVAWQTVNGIRYEVACEYRLKGNKLSFAFPQGYNKSINLIIDPVMMFATYSGSTNNNFGNTATYDQYGFLYSGSSSFGQGYPTTVGAYDVTWNGGGNDIALTKYDTTGTFLKWSTFIGGSSPEVPHSLVTNNSNELYCYGTTSSPDFPVTPNAYDTTWNGGTGLNLNNGIGVNYTNGSDIIVCKLSADGTQLLGSTYIGGSENDGMNTTSNTTCGLITKYNYADEMRGEILLDSSNVYVATCTRSADFPVSAAAFQQTIGGGGLDGVVIKLNGDLSGLLWSSYLGGDGSDAIYSVNIDNNHNLYLAGGTSSSNFPVIGPVVDSVFTGNRTDGFITHIQGDGQAIITSTYWGSDEYDQNYFTALDNSGNVVVFGQTEKYDTTFIINAAFNTPGSGQFITKFTPQLDSVIWSTVFGSGTNCVNLSPSAFTVDLCNDIYLSGWGGLTVNTCCCATNDACSVADMDTVGPYPNGLTGVSPNGNDFYLMVLKDDASAITLAGYFGGNQAAEHVDGGTSRFDRMGKIYQNMCAGCGGFSDMYTSPGAWSPTNNSSCNNGVFKLDFQPQIVDATFSIPSLVCKNTSVNFYSTGQGNTIWHWDFGDGDTSNLQNPTHTYTQNGSYTVSLVVSDTGSCNLSDTSMVNISIVDNTLLTSVTYVPAFPNCLGKITLFPTAGNPPYTYQWDAATGNQTTQTADSLCAGNYCVTITDASLCTIDTCLTLVVGVKEHYDAKGFTIHPNPTTGQFTVQGAMGEVEVYDLYGRLVLNANKLQLDMSGFPKGVYIVRVGEAVRKLVLN